MNNTNIAKLLGMLHPLAELVFLGAVEIIPVVVNGFQIIADAKKAGRDVSQEEMDRVQAARRTAFEALVNKAGTGI